jgi:hypothetical protein
MIMKALMADITGAADGTGARIGKLAKLYWKAYL